MVEPVILELAVNGATPRHRNQHVPRTPAEITDAALAGIESGASIVHNHNEEPMFTADGVHAVEPYLAAWRPVLERYPDALLYPTMAAGARGIPVARRWAHVEELARRGMGGMTLVDPRVGEPRADQSRRRRRGRRRRPLRQLTRRRRVHVRSLR